MQTFDAFGDIDLPGRQVQTEIFAELAAIKSGIGGPQCRGKEFACHIVPTSVARADGIGRDAGLMFVPVFLAVSRDQLSKINGNSYIGAVVTGPSP